MSLPVYGAYCIRSSLCALSSSELIFSVLALIASVAGIVGCG